jgi:hypothetical protein
MSVETRSALGAVGASQQNRTCAVFEEFTDNGDALVSGFSGAVHRFGHSLPDRSVVIDECVADVGERQPRELRHCVVGIHASIANVADQLLQRHFIHIGSCVVEFFDRLTESSCQRTDTNAYAEANVEHRGRARRILWAVRDFHAAGVANATGPRFC